MRRITFCHPPYHVSNPPQFPSYSNLPGPSAHPLYIGTLPSVKIPYGTYHKFVMTPTSTKSVKSLFQINA
jgi:hypothetical protein